jgi:hypothetical protein
VSSREPINIAGNVAVLFCLMTERPAKRLIRDFLRVGSNQGSTIPDAQLRIGDCRRSSMIAVPQCKNPPRISADGFLSEAIHFERNTMFDRTSQTKIEVFFHRWKRSTTDRKGFARAIRIN